MAKITEGNNDYQERINLVLNFFEENWDFPLSGKHHEIYLSDFRRVAPEKLRTIIRQPYTR